MSEEEARQPLKEHCENGEVIGGLKAISSWLSFWKGPSTTRNLSVSLFWRPIQLLPERILQQLNPSVRFGLLLILWVLWGASNIILTRRNIMALSYLEPSNPISNNAADNFIPLLNCGRNDAYWKGPGSRCGLDGESCIKSLIGKTLSFRCPMNCKSSGWTYQPWSIGAYEAMRTAVVIGGPSTYRGDSFICGAALHAGIISDMVGGCGTLEWLGPQSHFEGAIGSDGVSHSTEFNSSFPFSFRFKTDNEEEVQPIAYCKDLRILQILDNVFFLFSAAYFIPTANSPEIFLLTMAVFGFWTVILASDPPMKGGTPEKNAEIISLGFKRLLPTLVALVFIYVTAARRQLMKLHASLSRMVFWGGGYVIGILQNFAFAALPFDRLMISDLNSQPGAWLALGVLGIFVFVIVIGQAYSFWLEGEFPKFLKGYLLVVVGLTLLSFWPNQTLRLHHYFFALLLIPGTALKTTFSLLYQGFLVGLFISGVARWDFDSILQTSQQLSRSASLLKSAVDPSMVELNQVNLSNTLIQWRQAATESAYPGYSVLINDIERIREFQTENEFIEEQIIDSMLRCTFNLTAWAEDYFEPSEAHQTFYVRIAGVSREPGRGLLFGEYSNAVVANLF